LYCEPVDVLSDRRKPIFSRESVPYAAPLLHRAAQALADRSRDSAPVVGVVAFFRVVLLCQPAAAVGEVLAGALLVLAGLALFVEGLTIGLFPIGETLASSFARRGSVAWILTVAFALGFGTTVAEPALVAAAGEAAKFAADGALIADNQRSLAEYADGLRYKVALSVGVAVVLGVIRIIRGWPVQRLIVGAYLGVLVLTRFAPPEIVGIAFDSGGVTTSTITVPLVTALGVGLASSIAGRNPLVDGFGLIAFAALFPMMTVMGCAQIIEWRRRAGHRDRVSGRRGGRRRRQPSDRRADERHRGGDMSDRRIVRVRDVMKPQFDMVDGLATVAEALETMVHVDTTCLIVHQRHDDEFGIVTLADIARQVLAADRAPERVNIYEVMTKPVIHVSPEMDIRYCARLFARLDLNRAPVVEDGRVIGIVGYTDLVLKGLAHRY
jgi:CBS domain-containing protein